MQNKVKIKKNNNNQKYRRTNTGFFLTTCGDNIFNLFIKY